MTDKPAPVKESLNIFDTVEHWCNDKLPDLATEMSPDYEGMAIMLAFVRRMKKQIGYAEQYLEDELVKVWPTKTIEIPGLGVCEQHTGAVRKAWDKEAIITSLTHAIATTLPSLGLVESGEIINLVDHVRAVLDAYTVAATPSWKVTGLRHYGLDPDEYCETSWGRKTIQTPDVPDSTLDAG